MDLKEHIRGVPDFPKPGILFYDISTLLAAPKAWRHAIDQMAAQIAPLRPDVLAGIESRGFLVAAAPGAGPGMRLHHGPQARQVAGKDHCLFL